MDTQKNLIENIKKVCICRGITMGTIVKAIREGSLSFTALRRKIGVGTGNCKAKRCRSKIETKVKEHKKNLKPETTQSSY